jgi:NADH:ubiquinone oxidoreductase subunit E
LMRNNQYFYTFYSDTQLNSTDRRHCCVCTATMGI